MATTQAAIYSRVSKSEQDLRSIEEQAAACRAVCVQHGWAVTEYSDAGAQRRGVSASRFARAERPEYDKLLMDIGAGKIDVFCIWESSRGDRKLATWAALLDTCRAQGAKIHVVSHGRTYDPAEARDWRSLAEDGVDNAYESEKTSLRVRRALEANAAAGKPHGPVPYGYVRVYDPITKAFVRHDVVPEQAAVIREIISRAASGHPVTAIARDLSARGIPAPGSAPQWGRATVRKIALSPAYIGRRLVSGEEIGASTPPLVDVETFRDAGAILRDEARKVTRPGAARHLLSYLAACGICSSRLAANLGRYYQCPRGHVAIKMTWLDDYVAQVAVERLSQPDMLTELTARSGDSAEAARGEVATLRARHEEAVAKAADGIISMSALAGIEARLLPAIDAAQAAVVAATVPASLRVFAGADVGALWSSLPVAAQKAAIRVLMDVEVRKPLPDGVVHAFDERRITIRWRLF